MLRLPFLICAMVLWANAVPAAQPTVPSAAPAASTPAVRGQHIDTILPPDVELQRIADDRVVTYRDSVGLAIGVIEPGGRRIISRGPAQIGNDDAVDGETIFEIGSVTKVLTASLLADMAHRGELSLNDPVKKYLPPDSVVPEHGGHQITLADLATHTSGLPKILGNVLVTDFNNPNSDFTEAQILQSLKLYQLTRDPGASYEYSDAGYDLLGIALADRGQTDFETLLRSRILTPLHMDNTRFTTSLTERDHLAAAYDEHLRPVQHQRLPSLGGSGGMRSTANDLLNLLAANLALTNTPLNASFADMLKIQRPTHYKELKVSLGWHIVTLHGVEMVWLNGETGGSRAFIGFVPKLHTGVVVLSNSANIIDDIGIHILDPQSPLRKLHREVPVSASLFDNYVGRYQVSPSFFVDITRDSGHLYIQGAGQPRTELFAEADDKFFIRVADGEVTFKTDSGGRARSLELSQDGKTALAILAQ